MILLPVHRTATTATTCLGVDELCCLLEEVTHRKSLRLLPGKLYLRSNDAFMVRNLEAICAENQNMARSSRLLVLVVTGIIVIYYVGDWKASKQSNQNHPTEMQHQTSSTKEIRQTGKPKVTEDWNATKSDGASSAVDCQWASRTGEAPFFLTAVVLLRIRKESKSKTTTRELKQWLQYMRYIGVEHVYLYDAYYTVNESQKIYLTKFISEGFVTYTDWHEHNPYSIAGTQVKAYQDNIDRFGNLSKWQVAIDLDEYPFSPSDTKPGFLVRFIQGFEKKHPAASEITMKNYLFLGKPLEEEFLFQRIWRRTPKPANGLVKPIYLPLKVTAQVHHNYLNSGHSIDAPDEQLRMNHYWGARLQNWGEDTPKVIAMTQEDRSMESVLKVYVNCEKWIRKYLD